MLALHEHPPLLFLLLLKILLSLHLSDSFPIQQFEEGDIFLQQSLSLPVFLFFTFLSGLGCQVSALQLHGIDDVLSAKAVIKGPTELLNGASPALQF